MQRDSTLFHLHLYVFYVSSGSYLDVSSANVGDESAHGLARLLLKRGSLLRTLKLKNNRITDVGAQVLWNVLPGIYGV